jgi:hypothetical protein
MRSDSVDFTVIYLTSGFKTKILPKIFSKYPFEFCFRFCGKMLWSVGRQQVRCPGAAFLPYRNSGFRPGFIGVAVEQLWVPVIFIMAAGVLRPQEVATGDIGFD